MSDEILYDRDPRYIPRLSLIHISHHRGHDEVLSREFQPSPLPQHVRAGWVENRPEHHDEHDDHGEDQMCIRDRLYPAAISFPRMMASQHIWR